MDSGYHLKIQKTHHDPTELISRKKDSKYFKKIHLTNSMHSRTQERITKSPKSKYIIDHKQVYTNLIKSCNVNMSLLKVVFKVT